MLLITNIKTPLLWDYTESWFSLDNTELPHRLRETTKNFKVIHINSSYLYFYWPGEIADVNKESDVWIVAEIKFLIGEAVFVFLYIVSRNNWNFLPSLCASCFQVVESSKKRHFNAHFNGKQKEQSMLSFIVIKLTIQLNVTV